jgi:hypothetical protein
MQTASKKMVVTLLLAALLAAGCSKPSRAAAQEASIREAIQTRLAKNANLNMQAFQTEVKKVSVQGDHAQADVEFHLKDGPGVMQLSYTLEKRGNAWEVVNSSPGGEDASHSMPGQSPGGGAGAVDPASDPMRFFKNAAPPKSAPER